MRTLSFVCLGLVSLSVACSKGEPAKTAPETVAPVAEAATATAEAPPPVEAAAAAAANPLEENAATNTAMIVLPVEGMTCEACEATINGKVTSLGGVVSCSASHQAKSATIVYDPTKVSPDSLVAAIAESGYQASLPN